MGRLKRKRGFNDGNLWAARTTQSKVAGLSVYSEVDGFVEEKWTWAIPLEVQDVPGVDCVDATDHLLDPLG